MIVRRFQAASTREALREVREALGPDALILSNRRLPSGGVELVAMSESTLDAATLPSPIPARAEPPAHWQAIDAYQKAARAVDDTPAPFPPRAVGAPGPFPARSVEAPAPVVGRLAPAPAADLPQVLRRPDGRAARMPFAAAAPSTPPSNTPGATPPGRLVAPAAAPAAADAPSAALPDPVDTIAPAMADLAAELRSLRSLVEQQLGGFAWADQARRSPEQVEVLRRLLAAGLSSGLARELAASAAETLRDLPGNGTAVDALWRQVRSLLLERLRGLCESGDTSGRGGVFALVGPTGVGKTTTVAKLAARCVIARGAASTALLSTDGFRVGALDQLRIYGRILGVPVIAVRDENELEATLREVGSRHLTLIDTVGMSQRDRRIAEQVALLCGEGRPVQRVLLLSAAASGSTLEDVVQRYGGAGLAGCVLTKIDEALSLGGVLDVVLRHGLRVLFVTNGQRVPEDLHLPNPLYLVDRALRGREGENPFVPTDEDFPLVAASGGAGV
jgi:flagellar biosynthesis protein FlhF